MRSYPATLAAPLPHQEEQLAIKGVARRLGAGVASYPVRRYYVLIEGPTAEVDDDQILELKQIFDPMLVPGMDEAARPRFTDNGQRTLTLQRALQSGPAVDPLFGVGHAGGLRFASASAPSTSAASISRGSPSASPTAASAPATSLSSPAGRACCSPAATPAHPSTTAAPPPRDRRRHRRRPRGFLRETVDFVAAYAPVLDQDYAHLDALLADHGPRLGYFAR